MASGDYPLVINVGGLQGISATVSVSGSGTVPTFLNEVAVFNNFAVSQRTTIQLFNNTLYLCGYALIRVFDVTTPSNPTFIGAYGEQALNGHQISCSVNANASRPYLVSVVGPEPQSTLTVFDLSGNSQAPRAIAQDVFVSELMFTHVQRFVFDGDIGLANASWIDANGKHGNLLAVDFTDPANPVLISVLSSPKLNPFIRLASSSHTLYSVSGTSEGNSTGGVGVIDVYDTSDPQALHLTNEVEAAGTAILESFAVSGNTLLAAGNTADAAAQHVGPNILFPGTLTLTTMDVSQPHSPVVLATVDTGMQTAGSLRTIAFDAVNGGGLFLVQYQYPLTDINGPTSLGVVDARDPSHPVFYPQFTYYYYDGLGAHQGYVFAATGYGLNIYQALPQ